MRVYRRDYILAGDGLLVKFSILIRALHLVAGVAKENMIALLPSQVLLPCRLQSGLADIISALIHVGLALHILRPYL